MVEININKTVMSEQVYQSHKYVKILAMSRLDYNKYRSWDLPEDENGNDEGYLVEYLDGGKPNDSRHKGYISWTPKVQFENGYSPVGLTNKSLANTDVNGAKLNVPDLEVFGDGDLFKLISKASSKSEGWMKCTKAMEIEGIGCVVQVTTQQGDNIAEAVTFVPGVSIHITRDNNKQTISRKLIG